MDAYRFFLQSVLAIISLIGGMFVVVTSVHTGCWMGPPLYSVDVMALLGAGSTPKIL